MRAATSLQSGIAIVGMAGRFPGAPSVEALWAMLRAGQDAILTPTDEQLRAQGVDEARLQDPNFVRARMRFEGGDLFDAALFGYSPRHAQSIDPQQRIFLECAWEALERSGCDPTQFDGSIGVFAGSGANTYLILSAIPATAGASDRERSERLNLIEADKDNIATRVSYKLGLSGPSVGVQTACSSALVAVHQACQSLLNGECDMALAGGVSLVAWQASPGYLYVPDGLASRDGRCHTFDAEASGVAWGSGAGIVVLKRYEDALAAGDHIHALIESTAINNDGAEKIGYTAPSVRGQSQVIATAHALAGVSSSEIDMIEAHGTGTVLGDEIELSALLAVFGAAQGATRAAPCALGSLKTNIGHLDAAAGVAGLIKAALCVEHGVFVPSLNFNAPNRLLAQSPHTFRVNTETRSWPATPGRPRRAGVSSFGIGGTNAHALLREVPLRARPAGSTRTELFVLSAHTPSALAACAQRLAAALDGFEESDLASMAYTLRVGRKPLRHRLVALARDKATLKRALLSRAPALCEMALTEETHAPVAFYFQGDAVVQPGSLAVLHAEDSCVREAFDECVRAFQVEPAVALETLTKGATDPGNALTRRAALFTYQYCIACLLLRAGVEPTQFGGSGAGQITAACLAGDISVAQAAQSVLAGAPPGGGASARAASFDQISPGRLLVEITNAHPRLTPANTVPPASPHGDCADLDWASLLRLLGALWLRGARIRWSRHPDIQLRKVLLPTYPFEGVRHWISGSESPQADAHIGIETPGRAEPPERWVYTVGWRALESAASSRGEPEAAPHEWLILANDALHGAQLARSIVEAGHRVVIVTPGASFAAREAERFELDPTCAEDYSRLKRVLDEASRAPRTIVHAWSSGLARPAGALDDTFGDAQLLSSVLYLARAFDARHGEAPRSLLIVTCGLFRLGEVERGHLSGASLPGLVRVLNQELSGLRCRLLDVEGSEEPVRHERWGDILLTESTARHGEPVVARRGDLRLVPLYEPLAPESDATAPTRLRERGIYLITGGLGLIGLALATRLAQTCRARVALCTPGDFPPRARWEHILSHAEADAKVLERLRGLLAIEQSGGEVLVLSADVSNADQMSRAVASIEARFGPIHGVFHLAASMRHESMHRPLSDLSREDLRVQLQPKAGGLLVLAEILRGKKLDFGLLFSSNASTLGGLGYGAYASANSFLDVAAGALSASTGIEWIATNWDTWIDPRWKAQGTFVPDDYAISLSEGLDVLWRILRARGARQLVTSRAPLQGRLATWVRREKPAHAPAALPTPAPLVSARPAAGRNDLERAVVEVWQEVLGCEDIGVEDNFLELGGDSLMGLRIMVRLRELYDVDLPLKALFGPRPTVAALTVQLVSQLVQARAATATMASTQAQAAAG